MKLLEYMIKNIFEFKIAFNYVTAYADIPKCWFFFNKNFEQNFSTVFFIKHQIFKHKILNEYLVRPGNEVAHQRQQLDVSDFHRENF